VTFEGGNNTAFFHRVVNGKNRKKNTIFPLNHDEHVIEGDAALGGACYPIL
jgi:hypothetical protein